MTVLFHTKSFHTETKLILLTNGIELNALLTQVLRVDNDIILGFSISDQYTDPFRVRSHANVLFEIVLEDVVQSKTCGENTN